MVGLRWVVVISIRNFYTPQIQFTYQQYMIMNSEIIIRETHI